LVAGSMTGAAGLRAALTAVAGLAMARRRAGATVGFGTDLVRLGAGGLATVRFGAERTRAGAAAFDAARRGLATRFAFAAGWRVAVRFAAGLRVARFADLGALRFAAGVRRAGADVPGVRRRLGVAAWSSAPSRVPSEFNDVNSWLAGCHSHCAVREPPRAE
jgi:hypothetical protein